MQAKQEQPDPNSQINPADQQAPLEQSLVLPSGLVFPEVRSMLGNIDTGWFRAELFDDENVFFNKKDILSYKRISSVLFASALGKHDGKYPDSAQLSGLFQTNKTLAGVASGILVNDLDPEVRLQTLRILSRKVPELAPEYLVQTIEEDPDVDLRIKSFDILCGIDHLRAEIVSQKLLDAGSVPEALSENISVLLQEEPFLVDAVGEPLGEVFDVRGAEFQALRKLTSLSKTFLSHDVNLLERISAFNELSADSADNGLDIALAAFLLFDGKEDFAQLGRTLLLERDPEFIGLLLR